MQVYDILDVITARPSKEELEAVPHHLYGHISPGSEYSTGHWINDVKPILADIQSRGKIPIFVGGTGLYFKALNGGLSNIPPIPTHIRDKWRSQLEVVGIEELHHELSRLDPDIAKELSSNDKQRITRALEVFETTGKSIRDFQQTEGTALIKAELSKKIILLPERAILRERIATRFHKMVELGAIEEVQNILKANISSSHTSMKAIGVREISSYLKGDISLDEAVELSVIASRQYAKRQSTWFRNQLSSEWTIISNT